MKDAIVKETNFFNELFDHYSNLDVPTTWKDISSLNTINWYFADHLSVMVYEHNNNINELDIKSAFPTLCNLLFEKCEFLEKLNKIDDKLEKNIFISNSLKNIDSGNYLKKLNILSKMIIFGLVISLYGTDSDFKLYELKKDGIVFSYNKNHKLLNNRFYEFLMSKNINFGFDKYKKYYRFNKTSFFLNENDEIISKGFNKYLPPFLEEVVKNIIISNYYKEEELLKWYSTKSWEIISQNYLDELLLRYYICSNGKLFSNGKYLEYNKKNFNLIYPRHYLINFIFPLLRAINV